MRLSVLMSEPRRLRSFFVALIVALANLASPAMAVKEGRPLNGDWSPDDDSRGVIQLAQGDAADATSPDVIKLFARSTGSARTKLLPRPDEEGEVAFHYQTGGSPTKAVLIVQGLNKSFGSTDFLTFDLPAATDKPATYRKSFRLKDDATSTILRFRIEGAGTLRVDDLTFDGRPVTSTIVSGRLGLVPTVDPAADARPVGSQSATLNAPSPQPWKQVFVGGSGTVRTIKSHPMDGTLVTGSDVSGPFYWDAKSDLPADSTMPTAGFPKVPWTMHPTAFRATLDFYGRDNEGLIHTDQLAFDPTDPNVLYFAGGKQWRPGSGILITRDKGRSWTHVPLLRPDGKPVYIDNASSVERLKVDPANPKTIYYGSRRDGLYRSTDAGETWSLVENFPEAGTAFEDYGAPWIQFATIDGRHTTLVAAQPSKKESPFTTKVYTSTDQGETWAPTALPADGIGLVSGKYLYSSTKKVLKTDLATGQTTDITPLDLSNGKNKGWSYSPVATSPANPDWIVVFTREYSEGRFFRSKDGGKTWQSFHSHDHRGPNPKMTFQCAPYYPTTGGAEHTFNAVWDACFDAKHPSRLWMATWPGVTMTEDAWAEHPVFRQMGEGHEEVCLFDMISPSRGAPLVSGMMDVGGFVHPRLDMPPATAMVGVAPEGPHGQKAPLEVTSLDFCESDPNVIVSAVCWRYFPPPDGFGSGHARISTDGGKSWRKFAGEATKGAKDGRIAINPKDPNNIVWMPRLDANVGVYHTKDQGKTWQPSKGAPAGLIFPDFVFTFYKPLAADRAIDGQFYIYDKSDGRFYRSTDGGATFKHVARLPAVGGEHFKYLRIAAVPGVGGEVWAALEDQGLFLSRDGGDDWAKLEGVEHAVDVSFGPPVKTGGPMAVYFIGTIRGERDAAFSVYRSDDDGVSWTRIDDAALGWASVVALTADRQTPGRVYLGTNGRGMFYNEPPRSPAQDGR